ncbi:hypothetical protein B0G84_7822 [Paraburkholderia sp. BL8N3]|nr:hypothetical protein B0G84_7822 [Paraburkholderia sp. BL8N3]
MHHCHLLEFDVRRYRLKEGTETLARKSIRRTDAVNSASSTANDRPSSVMGPITPRIKEVFWPNISPVLVYRGAR